MTYRVWKNERPMVPSFDYDAAEEAGEIEVKAKPKKVRTAGGAELFDQPIGSVIVPDAPKKPYWGEFDYPAEKPKHVSKPGMTAAQWNAQSKPHFSGASKPPPPPPKPMPKWLGALEPDRDGLDTATTAIGMKYDHRNAGRPEVVAARAWGGWGRLPALDVPITSGSLHATEERVKSGPIRKILQGAPLRAGYDPELVLTDDGVFVADGHHRVAMHMALGHKTMRSRVLDLRGGKTIAQVEKQLDVAEEKRRVEAEKRLQKEADEIATKLVEQATKSEPYVTPLIVGAVEARGGHMEGLEHRIKLQPNTKGKIIRNAHRKRTDARSAASSISDVLRYTAVIPTDDYSAGVKDTLTELRNAGFMPTVTNNYWPRGDAYSGLNILFHGKGQDMEVQFHTPESKAAAADNHADYDISRDDSLPLEERIEAWERMVPKWDAVPQPPGWLDFGSLFIYARPDEAGRGRYVNEWEAQGLPTPPKPKPQGGAWQGQVPGGDLYPGEAEAFGWGQVDETGAVKKKPYWFPQQWPWSKKPPTKD